MKPTAGLCLFFLPWYVVDNVYWMKSQCRIKSVFFFFFFEAWCMNTVKQSCSAMSSNYSTYTVALQSLSHVQLFLTPWTAARQAFLSFTISQSLLKFISVESVMLSNHLILCCPLLLPSVFPSIGVFSNELIPRIRWPKYWSCSFSPFNEYSGLISFRINWFDLLAVWGTLKSLLQHHSSKASILWRSAFFMVQLSHLYTAIYAVGTQ